MLLLEPIDVGRHGSGTGFDAAVVALDFRLAYGGLGLRIIKEVRTSL